MAAQGVSGDHKRLASAVTIGTPAAWLGGFAMTDQVREHPELIAQLAIWAILICGLTAWVAARHPEHVLIAAAIGGVIAQVVVIDCLALLAFAYGETSITHVLTGRWRQPIGPLILNHFRLLLAGLITLALVAVRAPRCTGAEAGTPVKPVTEVGDEP
jgi:hypothetical protein